MENEISYTQADLKLLGSPYMIPEGASLKVRYELVGSIFKAQVIQIGLKHEIKKSQVYGRTITGADALHADWRSLSDFVVKNALESPPFV